MPSKVYISSTYEDLKEYREAVARILRKIADAKVIAMEDYVATDQRPLQKCLEDVSSSNIYVGIFAWRYGYRPNEPNDENPNNLSITELEYRKAKEKGIPCLIFLLDKEEWPLRFSDGTTQSGTTGDSINRLRNELKQNHSVSFFENKDALASNVLAAVTQMNESEDTKRLITFLDEHPGKRPYQRVQDNLKDFTGREWIVSEIYNWLESDDQKQFFILKGGPGSGKSSLVAMLVRDFGSINDNKKNDGNSNNNNESNSSTSKDTNNNQELDYIRSIVKGIHYIQFNISGTVHHLVENISSQLATTIKNEDFTKYILSLKESSDKKVSSQYDMFYERITKPLKWFYDQDALKEKILIIIDALDEEKYDESGNNIVSVLKTLNNDPNFPKNIRFLITTRPVDYITNFFSGHKIFDLSGELNTKDIKDYISNKLKRELDDANVDKTITKLNEKIEKSKNKNNENFLYWSLFIEYILQHKNEKDQDSLLEEELPEGVNQIYSLFLERISGTRIYEWKNTYHDLLGIITLQQGQGFSGLILKNILKRKNENVDLNSTISKLRQFIDGSYAIIPGLGVPEGPFHVFHKSFADFLLDEENNYQSFHVDNLEIHKSLVDYSLDNIIQIDNKKDYSNLEDYFIQYLSYHLYQLINSYWKLIKKKSSPREIINEFKKEDQKYRKLLYELTENQSFNQKQKEISKGDNTLILSTIQYALSSAILADDAPSIAKYMMMHAKKVLETKKHSPLDIIRNNQPLENAWNIADLYNPSNSSLLYLILAWELKEKGKIEDAKKTLQKLVKKNEKLTAISDTFKTVLFDIIIHIYEIDKEIFKFILKKLVNVNDTADFCKLLLDKGYLNLSFQVLQNIKYDKYKSTSIVSVAEAVAKFDDKDVAGRYVDKLVEIVDRMEDGYDKSRFIASIAAIVAKFDDKDVAGRYVDKLVEIVDRMEDDNDKSRSITSIAEAVAKFDDKDAAMMYVDKLVKIVDRMEDDNDKSDSITSIAAIVAKFDDKDAAMMYVDKLVKIVDRMEDDNDKSDSIASIAAIVAKFDDKDAAMMYVDKLVKIVDRMKDGYDKSRSYSICCRGSCQI